MPTNPRLPNKPRRPPPDNAASLTPRRFGTFSLLLPLFLVLALIAVLLWQRRKEEARRKKRRERWLREQAEYEAELEVEREKEREKERERERERELEAQRLQAASLQAQEAVDTSSELRQRTTYGDEADHDAAVAAAAADSASDSESDNDPGEGPADGPAMPKKIGKKKAARLKRKEQMKSYREWVVYEQRQRLPDEEEREEEIEAAKERAARRKAVEEEIDKRKKEERKKREAEEEARKLEERRKAEERREGLARAEPFILDFLRRNRVTWPADLAASFPVLQGEDLPALLPRLRNQLAADGSFAAVDGEGRLVYLDERDVEVLREWAVDQGRISKTDLWEEAVRRFT